MTPKEKAKELYSNFEFVYIPNYTSKHEVKLCALLVVDEILKNGGNYQGMSFEDNEIFIDIQYWENVKAEIERL